MKINGVTIKRKYSKELEYLTKKEWDKLLEEVVDGEVIEIVRVDY